MEIGRVLEAGCFQLDFARDLILQLPTEKQAGLRVEDGQRNEDEGQHRQERETD